MPHKTKQNEIKRKKQNNQFVYKINGIPQYVETDDRINAIYIKKKTENWGNGKEILFDGIAWYGLVGSTNKNV